MVVTATYSDGSTKAVNGYTYSPETFSAGDKTVTITSVSYTHLDVYKRQPWSMQSWSAIICMEMGLLTTP